MAGSLKWFKYTTDDTNEFAIRGDESNIEAVNGTALGWAVEDSDFAVPRNVIPRYAYYSSTNGDRVIKIPVLTQTIYNGLTGGATIPDPIAASGTLSLIRKTPERFRPLPTANDTGLNDGDNP